MVNIEAWMKQLLEKLKNVFGKKLVFVGLQGSYRRGEAHANSDIDTVVILDYLGIDELAVYRELIQTMDEYESACGFISGVAELKNWPRHELFQFANDTKAYYGTLNVLLPKIRREDIEESVKIGTSGIYHFACHSFVHLDEGELSAALSVCLKNAFFVLQAAYYLENGEYVPSKKELCKKLDGDERKILSAAMEDEHTSIKEGFELVINWSARLLG